MFISSNAFVVNKCQQDQEAFGIGIYRSYITFYHAFASNRYLRTLIFESDPDLLPEDTLLSGFNLATPEGRKSATVCLLYLSILNQEKS